MPIFGHAGATGGPTGRDVLLDYGDAALPGADRVKIETDRSPTGPWVCWGTQLASDGVIGVLVSGSPRLTTSAGASGAAAPTAILAGYRTDGTDILKALTGPFAIAILDRSADRVLLAIDRMGVGSLAYAVHAGALTFSTSPLIVARSPGMQAGLDLQSIFSYLLHHMIPAPDTAFRGVHKLRAGCYAAFEAGAVRTDRYWTPSFRSGGHKSFRTLKEELHQALRKAVADGVETETRVGTFLSGGLDSSTVTGMLRTASRDNVKTFSIGFGYPDYDELDYARIVNQHFGCQGHEHVIRGSDIVEAFPLIARAYAEPFGNSSALPTYYCARLARDHGITCLLAGDGGDELFAGNSRYAEQLIFERYKSVPAFIRRGVLEPTLRHWPAPLQLPLVRSAASYVRQAKTQLPERLESWNVLRRLGITETLCPDFLAAVDPRSPFERMQSLWNSTPSDAYLHRMLYYDWQYTLADNDLRKVETMSAIAGIRVVYPMLHANVVDMSTRVPPALMMPRGRLRDFYKRAMRGFLPDAVIQKKKHGFGLPFGLWLKESADLRHQIFDNLAAFRSRRILRPDFLDRLLHLHGKDDARYYGVLVWVIAMLEQWMREHEVSS